MNPAEKLLNDSVTFHREGNLEQAAAGYSQLLNLEPDNPGLLYLLGDTLVRRGHNGLGINLLRNAIAIRPTVEAYTALGCAYKVEHFAAQAIAAWEEGLKLRETAELYNNLASMYSDHGQPAIALGYIAKAERLEPNNAHVQWNKSISLLTAKQWVDGWATHEARFNPEVQKASKRRNISTTLWDGQPVQRLAVHGEQGIGDEIMFLSILPEVLARCGECVVEVEPRLMDLVERSFGVTTYGNEAALKAHEEPFDAQIALGSLGAIFRKQDCDFPGTAYLKADENRVAYWRKRYAEAGPGPYIGVAWQGGTKETRVQERTVGPQALAFCKRGTAISLQYGELAQQQAKDTGFVFYPESIGLDIDEQAAMVQACDVIVTVPQTLVHLAGALGKRCLVLTPLHSSWRYGLENKMVWYNSVELFRQKTPNEWGYPLAEVKRAIDQLCRETA